MASFSSTIQHTLTQTHTIVSLGRLLTHLQSSAHQLDKFQKENYDPLQICAGLSLRLYNAQAATEADSSPDLNPRRLFTSSSASNEKQKISP